MIIPCGILANTSEKTNALKRLTLNALETAFCHVHYGQLSWFRVMVGGDNHLLWSNRTCGATQFAVATEPHYPAHRLLRRGFLCLSPYVAKAKVPGGNNRLRGDASSCSHLPCGRTTAAEISRTSAQTKSTRSNPVAMI